MEATFADAVVDALDLQAAQLQIHGLMIMKTLSMAIHLYPKLLP